VGHFSHVFLSRTKLRVLGAPSFAESVILVFALGAKGGSRYNFFPCHSFRL
jgi:hypothetical protein